MTETHRYALAQRLLHWLIAVLVLLALGIGMILGFLGFDGTREFFGKTVTDALYTTHKTVGVLILALMLSRLGVRLVLGVPPYRPPLNGFERVASHTVHGPSSMWRSWPCRSWGARHGGGWLTRVVFGWTLPGLIGKDQALSERLFSLHGRVGWVLLGLVVLHVGAALWHWRVKRDGVMARMSLFR